MKKSIQPKEMENHAHAQHIVMVCVTRQRTCARLIARGEELAQKYHCPLHVVHAVRSGENFLGNPDEGEALEYLFTAAQLSGGELSVIRAEDVPTILCDYAKAHHASCMVLGAPPKGNTRHALNIGGQTIIEYLAQRLPDVELDVLD